ncbi:MAG: DUF2096 family protein [Candidatus Bathyarchaeia archaeon]
MGYLAVWKVLEEMVVDLRRKGISIPSNVVNDLRQAKTLIGILAADHTRLDTGQKIEQQLQDIEAFLVSEAQGKLGSKYVEEWLNRLEEAYRRPFDEEVEESRFIAGVPRDRRWIRIKTSADLPAETVKALAEKTGLSVEEQDGGYLLIYGEDELVKDFVKMIASKHKAKGGE